MFLRTLTTLLVAAAALLGSACNKSSTSTAGTKTDTQVKVKLQLNWVPEPEFGGFYAARESGAYAKNGLDVAIMGGLQVDADRNLANWAVPGKPLLGVGGAMDLASGARRLIVTLNHTEPDGRSKILPRCTLPLTALGAVDLIITELAVFGFESGQLRLLEVMPGATLDEVRAKTAAPFSSAL